MQSNRGKATGVEQMIFKGEAEVDRLAWHREKAQAWSKHTSDYHSLEGYCRGDIECFSPGVPGETLKSSSNKLHQGITCWAKERNSSKGWCTPCKSCA